MITSLQRQYIHAWANNMTVYIPKRGGKTYVIKLCKNLGRVAI